MHLTNEYKLYLKIELMKILKCKYLKIYNALIVFLISTLGFTSSCNPFGGTEYGTPSADFIVKGKIEAAGNNNPISGIFVEMRQEMESIDGQKLIKYNSTITSDNDGGYIVTDKNAFPENQSYKIKFIDTDGVLNGEYETLDTTIVFQNPKFTDGNGHWYNGQTEKEVNVKLKPKK
jgi:putative lipoprotein (rSAM/lipoprotein system)